MKTAILVNTITKNYMKLVNTITDKYIKVVNIITKLYIILVNRKYFYIFEKN